MNETRAILKSQVFPIDKNILFFLKHKIARYILNKNNKQRNVINCSVFFFILFFVCVITIIL